MAEQDSITEIQDFTWPRYFWEVISGIGEALGLVLLMVMEAVRNRFFRLLDLLHVAPRRRAKGAAFPPGPTRQRSPR